MLLRRITQHVKEQNWTAIAIDFVIVVVGVFIGIQVSNWNAARVESLKQESILVRLQKEVDEAVRNIDLYSENILSKRLANLTSARYALFGITSRDSLSSAECQSIGLSHLPLAPSASVPILSELSATGDLGLIADPSIVESVSKVIESGETAQNVTTVMIMQKTVLSNAFPNLVTLGLGLNAQSADGAHVDEVDEYDVFYTCDYQEMLKSPGFLNAAGENITLEMGFLELGVFPAIESLKRLKQQLDKSLDDT